MNKTDIAYIAGFFDGEGSLGIRKQWVRKDRACRKSHGAYITLSQKVRGPLEFVMATLGGTIYFNQGSRIWTWQQSGIGQVTKVLKILLPYLIVKEQQARLLIEAFSERVFIKKAGVPAEICERREKARLEIMRIKRIKTPFPYISPPVGDQDPTKTNSGITCVLEASAPS